MDVEKLRNEISNRMPVARYEHVLRVAETAKGLAENYKVSIVNAELAALFHDIAKFMAGDSLRKIIVDQNLDKRLLLFDQELWHGPVGALIAHEEFKIENVDVLNAIRFHTTGRTNMSQLEKIIYVADKIEPGRKFPGVEQLREIAMQDLDKIMGACIQQSVLFLVSKGVPVYPDSIDCYNEQAFKRGNVRI